MFKGISIEQFNKSFRTEDDCRQYLFDMKWQQGYKCRDCGSVKSYKGKTQFHLRCQYCGYDESVTANTIFHKLKIPLLKAFGMAFRIAVRKKGCRLLNCPVNFRLIKNRPGYLKERHRKR